MTSAITTESHPPLEINGHDPFIDDLAPFRELDARASSEHHVLLLWRPGDDHVVVRVDELRTAVRIELRVPGREAFNAFQHPFAYAA